MASKKTLNQALKSYEKSSADAKADKSNAKKAGISTKQYEGSPADKKRDMAAAKKMVKNK